ncbi:MAG: DUF1598 domain-containing protein [Thermoguttaceae bacterium]
MVAVLLPLTLVLALAPLAEAQIFSQNRGVGGILIDADGQVDNAEVDDVGKLSRRRSAGLEPIPGVLNQTTELRKISLSQLDQAIAEYLAQGKDLPDAIKYLGGLQQIQYVFVYPEQNDIVLVGPGEGWDVDKRGNIVGLTTRRPVMLLDDLLVALRTARRAAQGGISCSIDPTAEGLARLRQYFSRLRGIGNPTQTAVDIENALGPQDITVHGVPGTSHFARVLVAADYRMKRLAMNFEPVPIRGLPGFLTMMRSTGSRMTNMMPRWWLEPNYEPLLKSPDGLAWEFRGASVKAMTEADFLNAAGERQRSEKANPLAQRWADNMTEKFDELAIAEPIFGQLRNCMELAIVSALLVKERLPEKASFSMPTLMDSDNLKTDEFFAPKQVDSKTSMVKSGKTWIISASGGVQVNSWFVINEVEQGEAPAKARTEAAPTANASWCWN